MMLLLMVLRGNRRAIVRLRTGSKLAARRRRGSSAALLDKAEHVRGRYLLQLLLKRLVSDKALIRVLAEELGELPGRDPGEVTHRDATK